MAVPLRTVYLAAVALLFAAACAPAAPAGSSASSGSSGSPSSGSAQACTPGALQTLKSGTLTFGTDQPVYPPWFVDDKPESGQGFEGAVAAAIADGLGYTSDKVTWVRVPFNAAIQPGPKSYDVDLNEFSITSARKQAVDFSSPYYDVKQAVVALDSSPAAGVKNLTGLKSLRLGAQVGTTSLDAISNQIAPSAKPSVYNSNDDAKTALTNGQIDALVVDLPTAFYITSAELTNAKIVGQLPGGNGVAEQFGAVLDKDSPLTGCVSQAVDKLRSAGTLTSLEKQWLAQAGSAPELT